MFVQLFSKFYISLFTVWTVQNQLNQIDICGMHDLDFSYMSPIYCVNGEFFSPCVLVLTEVDILEPILCWCKAIVLIVSWPRYLFILVSMCW